ncbi:hypothetical protein [Pseudoalteromonas marina]|uniref:Uncharacterized protein n=1 Tax=Pseudoalteromonas marina TaxID=267375 RepID=A0ABT9FGE7_9GAMM|nr:hypothetical protein [Pseudoalteromonas marina]MDP2565818.1 hypothetical protein [Pseudoalteromonas marina]
MEHRQINTNAKIVASEDVFFQKAFENVITKTFSKIHNVNINATVAAKTFAKLASAIAGHCELTLRVCESDIHKTNIDKSEILFGSHVQPTKSISMIDEAIDSSIAEVRAALSMKEDVCFNKKRILATALLTIAVIANDKINSSRELALISN